MRIKGKKISIVQFVCLCIYYGFARYLPSSSSPWGKMLGGRWVRYQLCKRIFKKCGKNVNIEHGAFFGSGRNIEIGNNSGIGLNCVVPSALVIGENVMMGPNVYILSQNHQFERIDIPMIQQGYKTDYQTIIEDDVWIGRNVTMTPGRHIKKGTIVGACTLLCKDFPPYSIIGGNPSKLIRSRINGEKIESSNSI